MLQIMDHLEELKKLFDDKAKRETDNKGKAAALSPFSYIKLNENMSSRILADLLDPAGAHGQERRFLKDFSELPKLKEKKVDLAGEVFCIQRESPTLRNAKQDRRMDIFIRTPKGLLGVETKIWSGDQDNQLKDYLEHLKKEAAFRNADYWLLYLTPYGREPLPKSLPAEDRDAYGDKFICLAWRDVLQLLLKHCNDTTDPLPANLKSFLRDFIMAMQQKTGIYIKDADMDNGILDEIFEKGNLFDAVQQCYDNYPKIITRSICEWRDTAIKKFTKENFQLLGKFEFEDMSKITNNNCHMICIKFDKVPPFKAGILFETPVGKATRLFVQLTDYHEKTNIDYAKYVKEYRENVHKYFVDNIGDAPRRDNYCWCKPLDAPWDEWGRHKTLKQLNDPNDSATDRPEELLIKVCRAMDNFLKERRDIYSVLKNLRTPGP